MTIRERLGYYGQLIRIDRPIGTYLLLWPVFWALWIASDGVPDVKLLIVFVLGTFLMRSAGCAINDFADRKIDGHVERTKHRPLATGRISGREALGVFGVLVLAAFLLVLQLNRLTIGLSVVAVVLAATYPFMKRFHHLPQVHLGAAFAWSIPMAFAAVTGEWPPFVAWVLFVATVLWTTAYDTMYAMSDREDDLKIGVKSSAILFGQQDRLVIGVLQGATWLLLGCAGFLAERGGIFWLGLVIAAVLMFYQQRLIRSRDPQLCFQAFLNNNWVGIAVFIGLALDYAMNMLLFLH